jgi:DNA-binding MarR family transcriptional regulator
MVKENKFDSILGGIDIPHDDFVSRFSGNDVFSVWMLLDYAKFSVSRLRDYEVSKTGITPEQAAILQILDRREGKSSIDEIAFAWMRRENSVLTLVRRMEKLGLVNIIKYPKRRELEIVTTDKGREICSQITRISIESVFSVLSSEEIKMLSLYLRLVLGRARNLLKLIDE